MLSGDVLEYFRWINLLLIVSIWISLIVTTVKISRVRGYPLAKILIIIVAASLVKDFAGTVELVVRQRPGNYSAVLTTVIFVIILFTILRYVRSYVKDILALQDGKASKEIDN